MSTSEERKRKNPEESFDCWGFLEFGFAHWRKKGERGMGGWLLRVVGEYSLNTQVSKVPHFPANRVYYRENNLAKYPMKYAFEKRILEES